MVATLSLLALLFLSPVAFAILAVSIPLAVFVYNRIACGSLLQSAVGMPAANPTMVLAFIATLFYHFVPIFTALALTSVTAAVITMAAGIVIMAGLFRARPTKSPSSAG